MKFNLPKHSKPGVIAVTSLFATIYSGFGLASELNPLSRGINFFDTGDYQRAETEFNRVARNNPAIAETYYYLGLAVAGQGYHEKAVEAYRRALSIDPNLPGARLSLGIGYYHLNRYEHAQRELNRALLANPGDASAMFFVGLTHQSMGQYDQAVRQFQKSASTDPEFEQLAWYNAGISYSLQEQSGSARNALQRAIRIDPESETAGDARDFLTSLDKPRPVSKRWSISASSGMEYDDNVTVSDIDNSSGEDDFAGIFEFGGSYKLLDTPNYELEGGYDFYQSLYADLTDFNLQSHSYSLDGSTTVNEADVGLNYRYIYTSLGGERFFEINSIQPNVGFSVLPSWYANLNYNFQAKNFFRQPNRDADQHAFGLDNYLFFMQNQAYALLSYRLEQQDTEGPQFEYLGHYFTSGVDVPVPVLGNTPKIKMSYQYYLRNYENVTPSIDENRDDSRHTVTLGMSLPLSETWVAKLDYQHIEAISNLESFDFNENILSLSLGAIF